MLILSCDMRRESMSVTSMFKVGRDCGPSDAELAATKPG